MTKRLLLPLLLLLALVGAPLSEGAKRADDKGAVSSCAQLYTGLGFRVQYPPQGPRAFLPAPKTGTRDFH